MDGYLIERIRNLRLMVFDFDGVLTDNTVYVFEDGREAVRCWRSDGLGLAKLRRLGIEMAIISTEENPVVTARAGKLKLRCIQGVADKCRALEELTQDLGVSLEHTAFMGNDINDLPCLNIVGLPIVVQDAHPDVIGKAAYRTKASGGKGAVREVCDLIDHILSTGNCTSSE